MDIDLQLVLVEWLDANTDNDAVTLDNVNAYHKAWTVHTLGWCMREDEEGITLVTEYYDDAFRGRTFIPRAMIKSVTPYVLSRPRRKSKKSHTPSETPATQP